MKLNAQEVKDSLVREVAKVAISSAVKWVFGIICGIVILMWGILTDSMSGPAATTCGLVAVAAILIIWGHASEKRFLPIWRFGGQSENAIEFTDPLAPPGWRIIPRTGTPDLETIDVDGGRALKIKGTGDIRAYAMDYSCKSPIACEAVSFTVKDFESACMFYIRMQVIDEQNVTSARYFTIVPESLTKRESKNEHRLPISPEQRDGWSVYRIDIDKWFQETFAKDDLRLQFVDGFRIRGGLTIRRIEWV